MVKLGFIERFIQKYKWASSISQNITLVRLPELELGMDRNLWGLTLWLWTYSLQMAKRNIVEQKGEKEVINRLKQLGDHARLMDVHFKPFYPLKYPALGAIKIWHTFNRVRPFTYQRKTQKRIKFLTIFIVSFAILFYLIVL